MFIVFIVVGEFTACCPKGLAILCKQELGIMVNSGIDKKSSHLFIPCQNPNAVHYKC